MDPKQLEKFEPVKHRPIVCHQCGKEYTGLAEWDAERDGWYRVSLKTADVRISECPDCHGD